MRRIFLSISTLLLLSTIYFAQSESEPSAEFKINQDNIPPTFIQKDAYFFGDPNIKIVVAWEDYRDGELTYYAQIIDSQGDLVGRNFQINGNFDICLMNDGKILALSEKREIGFDGTSSFFYGNIYGTNNMLIKNFELAVRFNPILNDSWFGLDTEFYKLQSSYFYYLNWGGEVDFIKFSASGEIELNTELRNDLPHTTVSGSCEVVDGGFIYPWFSAINFESAAFNRQAENLPAGLYVSKFDPSFNYVKQNIPLKQYTSEFAFHAKVLSTTFSDASVGIFLLDADSAKIQLYRADQPLDNMFVQNTINFVYPQDFNPIAINSFSISLPVNNTFYVLASIKGNDGKVFNVMQKCGTDGFILGEAVTDNSLNLNVKKILMPKNENSFLIGENIDSDVHLSSVSNFILSTNLKLNDDASGGNELTPEIFHVEDEILFFNYHDEKNIKGRFALQNGTTLSGEKSIKGKDCIFFGNNKNFIFYNEETAGKGTNLKLSIYSRSWTEQESRVLYENRADIVVKKITDTTCVLLASMPDRTEMILFDWKGTQIKNYILQNGSSTNIRIFLKEDGKIWVYYSYILQLFSNDLVSEGEVHTFDLHSYIGYDRFLNLYTASDGFIYGQVVNSNGSKFSNEFVLTGPGFNIDDFEAVGLDIDEFLIALPTWINTIHVSVRRIDGSETNAFRVNESTENFAADLTVMRSGSKLIFAWSEVKYPGLGYDVFFKTYPVKDLITEVESHETGELNFTLNQNYPNPFNPSTVISYQLVVHSNVTLKLYDVLGREVVTLIDEYQSAGDHQVKFDGSSLPSGIYFYKLTSGEYSDTKKLVLLK